MSTPHQPVTPAEHPADHPASQPLPPIGLITHPVILYDGLCGFCNRSIRLLIRNDSRGQLLFAPLESLLATRLLAVHGRIATQMDSVALILAPDTSSQQLFLGTEAVGQALAFADSPWPILGKLILATPRWLRDPVYRFIARVRYRLFGKYATCPIPTPAERSRFLGF